MSTINGKACVANGRNLLTGTSSDLKTKQLNNNWNVGPQATNGDFKIKLVKGQTYTYRVWLDNTNGQNDAYVNARFRATAESNLGNGTHVGKGEIGYSTLQVTPSEDGYIQLIPFAYSNPVTALAVWKEEKLEKGSVATDWLPAPVDKVFSNGKQVYGRNLLLGSRNYNGDQWSGLQSISGTYKGVSIVSVSNNETVFNYDKSGLVSDNKINISSPYVLSMYVKNTSSAEITITFYGGSTNENNTIVSKVGSESDWVMISKKISFWTKGGNSLIGIGLQGIVDNSVLICCIKLEKGSVATPWSPAPEDVM